MLRQGSGDGGNKRPLSRARLSQPNVLPLAPGSSKTLDMGRSAKANPLSAMGLGHVASAPGADPDYIMQLVDDVRKFADVLLSLKEAFHAKESQACEQQVVQECLGELLRVLRAVIGKHQTLNSVDILSAAGTVIAKVKGVNFEEVNHENKGAIFGEIYTSIDTLAFTFGNVVSDFLMGDVDSRSKAGLQSRRSRSFENLSGDSGGHGAEKHELAGPVLCSSPELSPAQQVDQALLRADGGVESALLYAKAWSKYTKDLLAWVDKRLSLDIECAKGFAKIAESAKTIASQQDFMPFRDIYVSAFKNDIEYSQVLLQTAAALQTNKFIQPLLARKNELDKLRKEIKEQWQREQKKTHEADAAVRKAQLQQVQRREEHEKARTSTCRSEEEQTGGGTTARQLERKRRLEEEALTKAEEAQELYRACVADAGVKRASLANAKSSILTQIRELVFQCDLTLKAVTVNWFQMQQAQTVALPCNHQALCESVKLYEPGQRYAQFIRSLPKERVWLESLSQDSTGPSSTGLPFHKRSQSSTHSSHGNLSQVSVTSVDAHSADDLDSPVDRTANMAEQRSHSSADIHALRTQASQRAWGSGSQGGGMCSDSESAGGSSESRSIDSPTASPGDFKRRLPRTPSTGTMSSADDLDEREPPSLFDNGLGEMVMETASSPGPFRNAQMSKAAHTHKLRKLRAPSKCRECDSLVVFHGADCEECSLACHKKCLETLAIQCGHKKLQGRLHLFGIDFALAAKNSPGGIPFIIRKCISEIESRALNIKGIYRVNGAKSRVEKLCQAFENGKDLVELSDLYPHDISNVLKLYLRQLPEPLILYRYYNDFIGLAKETQGIMADEVDSVPGQSPGQPPHLSIELNRVIFKIRDLLRQLPPAHYRTLQFLIAHLHRVTESAEENKMTASNLGIIFGPTLVKPRQTEAEVSLSSLVDYPYQALMVELLVRHHAMIFDVPLSPTAAPSSPPVPAQGSPVPPQRLSRHSRSLLDIKEGSKVYKRHSSVIPSSHLLDEVKEVKGGERREPPPERQNGVLGPCSAELQRSTLVFGRPSLVQLRPPRSRVASRPISLPVDQLLSERNSRNAAERERCPVPADAIQERAEPGGADAHITTGYHRSPFIDTQTLRRTWDRQYRRYDVTPRTAKIVANLPVAAEMGPSAPATASVSVMLPSSVRPAGRGNSQPISFRKPRTLQPPPGTFYRPPSRPPGNAPTVATPTVTIMSMATSTTAVSSSGAAEEQQGLTAQEEAGVDLGDLEVATSAALSTPQSPGNSPEDGSPGENKPVYQRLRTRRLPELEQREAHFV